MTAATRNTGARFRTRKLSTKQSLQIFKEDQIDAVDDEQRNIAQIETGVERNEEIEHHLQAAISASQAAVIGGKVSQTFIPTPDASKLVDQYDKLYPKRFSQPSSYIRFSSTVEDCSGCLYSIGEEDDIFLAKLNAKRSTGTQCSEDVFENVMQHFEATTQQKQPFLGLNNDDATAHLLSFEDLESNFEEAADITTRAFAKQIYPYWKEQRLKRLGRTICPSLKFEQGQVDKDDGDPYVCFRRREHRPARKTRRTDAQSIERLKKLRLDMEKGRFLIQCVAQREDLKREQLDLDKRVFTHRAVVKEAKRRLGIKGDDEDLVNRPRKRVVEQPTPILRQPLRTDGRAPEHDLRQLEEVSNAHKQQLFRAIQESRRHRHIADAGWNDQSLDLINFTKQGPDREKDFRAVSTFFLPSPPPSVSPSSSPDYPRFQDNHPKIVFSTGAHTNNRNAVEKTRPPARFRRRTGRGGRIMLDRRGMKTSPKERDGIDDRVQDRFKYDNDDSDEENHHFIPATLLPSPEKTMSFRAGLFMSQFGQEAQARREAAANNQTPSNSNSTRTPVRTGS